MVARSVGIAVSLLIVLSILVYEPLLTIDIFHYPQVSNIAASREETDAHILFVGDIMLGRGVEERITKEGIEYPFRHVRDMLAEPDVTVGNFEGIVKEDHVQAPSMTFRFSIRNEYLTYLKTAGFDILSLANNHAFDYGIEALEYTRKLCKEIGIACPGSPNAVGRYTLHTERIGDTTIGFAFIHAALAWPDESDLSDKLRQLEERTDVQIAYVHWGDEYELVHGKREERLARFMVDHGVDAVYGHHPHVVQDVELYQGKPIFYSLGNFIFDQYFSEDVQQGLSVLMRIEDEEYIYELYPLTSKESRNQPRLMEDDERNIILGRILEPLRGESGVDIENGTIRIPRHLAR